MSANSRVLRVAGVIALLLSLPRLPAQSPTLRVVGKVHPYPYTAGPFVNDQNLTVLAAEKLVRFPKASFLQISFKRIELGEESSLEVISLLDDQKQVWTRESLLAGAGLESYYFNGEAVLIRLWAGPKSRANAFEIQSVAVGNPADQLSILTLCGADNRVKSSDPRVARIILKKGTAVGWCTAWLISPVNCFATAGHCLSGVTMVTAEFNVPMSTSTGALVHPPVTSQYTWEGTAYRSYESNGVGKDWGVFTTKKNTSTNRYPGSVQGNYFRFAAIPPTNTTLRVTGHGTDTTPNRTYNAVQQTSTGPLTIVGSTYLGYRVDTMGGNSGSPVSISSNGYAVAVHTHGGCTSTGGYNKGTRQDYAPFVSARARHSTRKPYPDFRPTYVGASSSILKAGSTYTLYGRVYNYGTATAPMTYHGFYISTNSIISTGDLLVGTFASGTLPVGSYRYVAAPYTMPRSLPNGSCWLGIYADYRHAVTEEDELNNTIAKPVTCIGLPDLTVTYVKPSATTLYPNLAFTMTATIKNAGSASAPAATSGHYLSTNSIISTADTLLGSFLTYAQGPGISKTYTMTVRAPATLPNAICWVGTYADRLFRVAEVNESNNSLGTGVTCRSAYPRPDLVVSSFSASTTSWHSGQHVTCTAVVRNSGTAAASNFYTGFYFSKDSIITTTDSFIGRYYVTGLGVNASKTLTLTATIPSTTYSGTAYLGAYADYTHVIAESNEANNTKALAGTITGLPDLMISYLSAPTAAQAGAYITATVSTKNLSLTAASTSMTGLFLSTNSLITHFDTFLGHYATGTLTGGASRTVTFRTRIPFHITGGTYYFGAWADHTSAVSEYLENNNVRLSRVSLSSYTGVGKYVEFQPRWGTAATLPDYASFSALLGGTAYMAVTAPNNKGYWYLLLWSGSSTGFRLDALTNFQLALLNTPVFYLWFGRTSLATGIAYPRFMIPRGVRIPSTFYAYTYSAWFTPNLKNLIGFGTNHIRTRISP